MIIKHSHELKELYNLSSVDIVPVEGFDRRTGWNVNVAVGDGYFYATNENFGTVEGSISSSVSANEHYVLTDFMRYVKFKPSVQIEEVKTQEPASESIKPIEDLEPLLISIPSDVLPPSTEVTHVKKLQNRSGK
jgi:hypothetical protein